MSKWTRAISRRSALTAGVGTAAVLSATRALDGVQAAADDEVHYEPLTTRPLRDAIPDQEHTDAILLTVDSATSVNLVRRFSPLSGEMTDPLVVGFGATLASGFGQLAVMTGGNDSLTSAHLMEDAGARPPEGGTGVVRIFDLRTGQIRGSAPVANRQILLGDPLWESVAFTAPDRLLYVESYYDTTSNSSARLVELGIGTGAATLPVQGAQAIRILSVKDNRCLIHVSRVGTLPTIELVTLPLSPTSPPQLIPISEVVVGACLGERESDIFLTVLTLSRFKRFNSDLSIAGEKQLVSDEARLSRWIVARGRTVSDALMYPIADRAGGRIAELVVADAFTGEVSVRDTFSDLVAFDQYNDEILTASPREIRLSGDRTFSLEDVDPRERIVGILVRES